MNLDKLPTLAPLPKGYKLEYSQDTASNNSMVCRIPDTDIWYIQTPVPIIKEED